MIYKEDKTIYRSSINGSLIEMTLKRASLLGGSGAILLIFGGTIIPLEHLSLWGAPFFLLGLFFIALGFVPYKKLTELKLKPYEIHHDERILSLCRKGQLFFELEMKSIEKLCYLQKEHLYGIGIWLKQPDQTKLKFSQSSISCFLRHPVNKAEGCHIFLPFFNCKTADKIKDLLESDHAF